MKSTLLALAALGAFTTALGACTTAQSARPLAPGKTQVSVALTGNRLVGTEDSDLLWTGQVMVRRGLSSNADLGVSLTRVPGSTDALSLALVDSKVRLTPEASETTISASLGGGLIWADRGFDFDLGAFVLTPALYLGLRLSPTAEAVLSPRLYVLLPQDDNDEREANLGGTVGIRFTNPARTWALHPELGLVRFAGEATLSLGLSISAGD